MQSIRRAALRSALSASRAVSSTTRSAPFSAQIARQTISPIARPSSIVSARLFSQTARVANEEKIVEEAEIKPTEETEIKPTEEAEIKSTEEAEIKSTEEAEATTFEEVVENVQEFRSQPPRERETPYGVFVRNLVFDAHEEHLRLLFSQYGELAKVAIGRDAGKMSKGFGFVYFKNGADREAAVQALNNTFWHGRRIFVSDLAPRPERRQRVRPDKEPSACLYVGNIPFETKDSELNELFSSLDGVIDVRVAVDRTTGWPRGFCHVDFKDIESATAAKEKLTQRVLGLRQLKADFAEQRRWDALALTLRGGIA